MILICQNCVRKNSNTSEKLSSWEEESEFVNQDKTLNFAYFEFRNKSNFQ